MLKFKEIGVFLKKPGWDPVGIQSGPSRDPVGTQSGTNFCIFGHRFWPVGIQSGTNFRIFGTTFGPVGKQPKSPKNMQKHCKNAIFYEFGCLPTLVPDWIPTGSRLAKSGAQKCKNWCPTGSRRDPDWIHRSARTHSRTYFSLPRPTLAPIFLFRAPAVHQYPPPSCTKTAKAVLSQTGVLQYIYNHCCIGMESTKSIQIPDVSRTNKNQNPLLAGF